MIVHLWPFSNPFEIFEYKEKEIKKVNNGNKLSDFEIEKLREYIKSEKVHLLTLLDGVRE